MSRYDYRGPERYRPISAWGYVGYSILFLIPVIGWICWIVCVFSGGNINRRSYARSYICHFLLTLILSTVFVVLMSNNVGNIRSALPKLPFFNAAVDQIGKWLPEREDAAGKAASTPADNAENEPDAASAAPSEDAGGVRKEVKDAIDDYEAFFRDYADFMKNQSGSSTTLSEMTDTVQMMMVDYPERLRKWLRLAGDLEMNDAELDYYAAASLRINQMLSEVE